MTSVDITDWHPERIAGFVEAIKGDHPSVEIECIVRHHDTDRAGQMSMSLSDEPASDFVARRCETVPDDHGHEDHPAHQPEDTHGARARWGNQ
jgi:hypothetical protein